MQITYREALDAIEANRNAYENPFLDQCNSYRHRTSHAELFAEIQKEIDRLFYPNFISYHEDAEFIASLIRLTMSRRVLELGVFSGFTTLHMLRAVYPTGMVVGIDSQKVYSSMLDRFPNNFVFHQGDTVEVMKQMGGDFDFVYVDSDHSPEHTSKELSELVHLTHAGSVFAFHDCNPKGPLYPLLVTTPWLRGLVLPSASRLDVSDEDRPHMGVFMRV